MTKYLNILWLEKVGLLINNKDKVPVDSVAELKVC